MSQITTHILDTSLGKPAEDVAIQLHQQQANGEWLLLGEGKTNSDGRIADLLDNDTILAAGTYRMHFATAGYFEKQNLSVFYPWAEVVFNITGDGQHYHIPLLLNPFGYSTYRGS
jgi:5-hydroxyisourate hydrolase